MMAVEPLTPWYRQFWPWFLIVLPGAVVIASFFTLYIAIKNPDPPVHGNYERHGLTVLHKKNPKHLPSPAGREAGGEGEGNHADEVPSP